MVASPLFNSRLVNIEKKERKKEGKRERERERERENSRLKEKKRG